MYSFMISYKCTIRLKWKLFILALPCRRLLMVFSYMRSSVNYWSGLFPSLYIIFPFAFLTYSALFHHKLTWKCSGQSRNDNTKNLTCQGEILKWIIMDNNLRLWNISKKFVNYFFMIIVYSVCISIILICSPIKFFLKDEEYCTWHVFYDCILVKSYI